MLLQSISALALSTTVLSLTLPIALAAPAPLLDSVRITSVTPEDGDSHNLNKEKRTWIWEEPDGGGPAKRTWEWSSPPGHDSAADTDSIGDLYNKEKRTWVREEPGGGAPAKDKRTWIWEEPGHDSEDTGGGSKKRNWTWEEPGGGAPAKRTRKRGSPSPDVGTDSIGWEGPGGDGDATAP